jgi:hypothetical protein
MSALATIGAALDAAEALAVFADDADMCAIEREYASAWRDKIEDVKTAAHHLATGMRPVPRNVLALFEQASARAEASKLDLEEVTAIDWPEFPVRARLDCVFATKLAEAQRDGYAAIYVAERRKRIESNKRTVRHFPRRKPSVRPI